MGLNEHRRASNKAEMAFKGMIKHCMICEWEKRDDYRTNISSPGFDQCQKYRGYLETPKHEFLSLGEFKKNDLRMLRYSTSRILRQESTTNKGSVLRGCPHISGCGSPESQV